MTLVVGIVVVLAGYASLTHLQAEHPVDARASSIACEEFSTCRSQGFELDATPFQRRYSVKTDRGTVIVVCRWPWLLWGEPECQGEVLRRGPVQGDGPSRFPHQVSREAPPLSR